MYADALTTAMRFSYRKVDSLPRLAWCARVVRDASSLEVIHGPWVETQDEWFVEGAWLGPFRNGGLSAASIAAASGGHLRREGVEFSSATHTLERLHLIRAESAILVSNSLALALTLAEDHCDLSYQFYESDFISFTKGVRRLVSSVPTRRGRRVHLLYCCNVLIDRSLSVRYEPKVRPSARFHSYSEYVGWVRSWLEGLSDNASASERAVRFAPLASISSGYDSPACAVLAESVGCREAVTFRAARESFALAPDSGLEIGRQLGFAVREYDRAAYRQRADFPEAEFLAVGTGGEDVVMSEFEPELVQRLFITGFLGDTVWGLADPDPAVTDELKMTYPAGASLAEFKLRVGFIHVPLPQLQHGIQRAVHAVSIRDEMKPWRLGTDYDRPIPRRLVEERGVPRSSFGQVKKAVTQTFYHNEPLALIMSAASYESFRAFAAGLPSVPWGRRAWFRAMRLVYACLLRVTWRMNAVIGRLGLRAIDESALPTRYRQDLTENAFAFHWALDRVLQRYSDSARSL